MVIDKGFLLYDLLQAEHKAFDTQELQRLVTRGVYSGTTHVMLLVRYEPETN